MNNHYYDILSRIDQEPLWWDENAVPRFDEFTPHSVANIYADQVVLALITCQGCGQEYRVAFSSSAIDRHLRGQANLADQVGNKTLHYGDPPNASCCSAGPTMNSEPRRVLEFWTKAPDGFDLIRVPDLEIDIQPDWVP